MTGDPFRFSNAPTSSLKAAPQLGQNTNEVLRKLLEFSDEQMEMLAMENII